MRIKEAIDLARKSLRGVCERPVLEGELLLCKILARPREYLHLNGGTALTARKQRSYRRLLRLRAMGYPLEYLTRRVSFYSAEFFVRRGVLIPRPQTEHLVDLAAGLVRGGARKIAEVGTGSGVVSITLAKLFPHLEILATDLSPRALAIAKQNAAAHGAKNIEFIHCNLLDGVRSALDLIVSNPPYISPDYPLPRNVSFEPKEALFAPDGGLGILKELILLKKTQKAAALVCEIGYDQRERIADFCREAGAGEPRFYKDYDGLDRNFVLA